ncbi:MAG: GNAT family N-acetyltransferase [Balneolales bacterium]|nr:GNAT family N-acetyltransferase [Balneolales bacterium]
MNTTGITIVTSEDEKKKFIEFQYSHYKDDPVFVPPLRMDQKKLIDTKKNPFYNNAEVVLFIAEHNGEIAGRISATVDHRFNNYHNSKTGHFGFFECIDHQPTADLLFRVAEDWLRDKGVENVLGPASPGMMDMIGILVEGFEYDPYILMPYSKPYYDKLIKNSGYDVEMELLAFVADQHEVPWDRMDRAKEIVFKRNPGLTIRPLNLKKIKDEVEIVRNIYNQAWATNWGFLPLTKEELAAQASEFRLILDPDVVHFAEMNGEPIGFSISLPDLNMIFKKMNGNLFPFGIFRLLFGRKKINRLRTALMGVVPEYQGKGIEALLNQRTIELGVGKGYGQSELSWVLGNNQDMIRVAERLGARIEKRYNMYTKVL